MSGLGERRFSGMLTDEFHLWRLARPFMDEVHEVIRGAVTGFGLVHLVLGAHDLHRLLTRRKASADADV